MAGETPNADRVARERRRRLAHLDVRASADDKYYRGTPSVFDQASREGIRRGTAAAAPPPRRLAHLDVRASSDKYYAEQPPGQSMAAPNALRDRPRPLLRAPVPAPARRARPAQGGRAPGLEAYPGLVRIGDAAAIAPGIDLAIDQLHAGTAPVTIEVADAPAGLLRAARALLDARVTQAAITEDQGRDVRFVRTPAERFAAPAPNSVPGLARLLDAAAAAGERAPAGPAGQALDLADAEAEDAFLTGAAPGVPEALALEAAGAPEAPEAAAAEEAATGTPAEDDGGFYSPPPAEAEAAETTEAADAEAPEAAEGDEPHESHRRRGGRRSGRGAH